ncbi:MAG: SRPBCC family protein [Actinomycetota bacterium]
MATILLRMPVDAEPGTVYEGLAGPDGVSGWWSERVEGPAGIGSTMRVAFPDAPMTFDFELAKEEPGESLVWRCLAGPPEWIDTDISFEIETDDEGKTSVLFRHGGWETTEQSFPFIAYSWAQILPRLKSLAETGKREPFFRF